MTGENVKLVTSAAMREVDRVTISEFGLPGVVLMEHAGQAVARLALELLVGPKQCQHVLILCGTGNNGGDGFVVARVLANLGFPVTVALFGKPEALKGDAATFWRPLSLLDVNIVQVENQIPDGLFHPQPEVIVDAIFGTGLTRPIEGVIKEAVEISNSLPASRIAVDVPTGIGADDGRVTGTVFKADHTVTFGLAKVGHFCYPGAEFCGQIQVADIGIPNFVSDAAKGITLLDKDCVRAAFPKRDKNACKNRFGHLAVVLGLPGKTGAAILAAQSAMRAGAGLVTIAGDSRTADLLEGSFPDLMISRPWNWQDGQLEIDAGCPTWAENWPSADAVVIGPGLSTRGTAPILKTILALNKPTVLDADALNLLAIHPVTLNKNCVLTPHPGEAARLLGVSTQEIQANRLKSLVDLVAKFEATVVLKGAGTLVGSPDGTIAISSAGGPVLATAGSGDVLAGIIGAMIAKGLDSFEAACAAVELHGVAGQLALDICGEHGLTATGLVSLIPQALLRCLTN